MTIRDLLRLDRSRLSALLAAGGPVDPARLAGSEYRGVSLGLPDWVERATWKKFMKSFALDGGGVRGWNVRIVQDGLSKPWRPITRRGRPVTFGHFDVEGDGAGPAMLHYRGAMRFVRDPLVALDDSDDPLLLGRSLLCLGGLTIGTPSYFALERNGPLTDRAPARRGA